jgi:hypothetical protein
MVEHPRRHKDQLVVSVVSPVENAADGFAGGVGNMEKSVGFVVALVERFGDDDAVGALAESQVSRRQDGVKGKGKETHSFQRDTKFQLGWRRKKLKSPCRR